MEALDLLNGILENPPGSTVKISLADAKSLQSLGKRSLGELWDPVQKVGIITALETYGLFGRKIRVMNATPQTPA